MAHYSKPRAARKSTARRVGYSKPQRTIYNQTRKAPPLTLTPRKRPAPLMPDLTDYLTTEEAAKKLKFHVDHIRRMLRQGDLEGLKVGQMWFVKKQSVDKYLKETEGLGKFDPRRGN